MARGYERLSGLDHSFLHFETATSYMHMALTSVFEPGSLGLPDGGVDIERIRAHVAARLHLIPRYRQRLHWVPVTSDPIWVDDGAFDLGYHVRHSHLPRPGTEEQLKALCGRILERPLDRRRPLWEIWIVEGLPDGRFAMLSKVHHCMVDGIAGIDLLAALLLLSPGDRVPEPEPWTPAPVPGSSELLRDELRRRASASIDLARSLPDAWGEDARRGLGERLGSLWGFVRAGVQSAGESPLNRPIGPHRRVEWLSFDLAEVKEIKRRLGGTLNDVVLATVTGAMRRFLEHRGAGTDAEFRAFVPVSTRAKAERGQSGNRVSAWITPLPVDEPSPLERHRLVRETTDAYRAHHEERGAEVLTRTADWTTGPVLGLAVRMISQTRAFNTIVTNIPGPPVPLYLLDAPMVAAYPHVPLFENQGLGIALLSYAGRLSFGLVADWDLVPDLERIGGWLEASFAELRRAAGIGPVAVKNPRRLPRRPAAQAVA